MKRLIKLHVFCCFESKSKYYSITKFNRIACALLFICGLSLTQVNAQTVKYEYDASGNVKSKKVVKAQTTSNIDIEKDTLPSWGNFFVYVPSKIATVREHSSIKLAGRVVKNQENTRTKSVKEKVSVTSKLSNVIVQSPIVTIPKKKNNTI